MTTEDVELSSFFEQTEFDTEKIERYADAVHASFHARERFDTLLNEHREAARTPDAALRTGLGLLIVCRFSEALEVFEQAGDDKLRHFYAAQAALALNRYDVALQELQQAARHGWDAFEVDMRAAAVHIQAGDAQAADKLARKHEQHGPDRAPWHYVQGLLAEMREGREVALAAYDKAVVLDPDYTPALFRGARLYDQTGADKQALEFYDRLAQQPRAHINALINAAVIYEDIGRFNEALRCLRRVLRAYPTHARARLFLKDVESCQEMVIDEDGAQPVDARTRLLDMPLSEFELSVRARNCLKKMNIHSLGELIDLSETELLAYKNFGETSLNEIRALLEKKGLHLGQHLEEAEAEAPEQAAAPKTTVPPGQQAVLNRSVAELELSVRARRCLQRLDVRTLGDLLQFTEQDLLSTRNFGVTSLTEINARLADHGLKLPTKKPD